MIAFVRGTVASVSPGSAVVEVGGVGLEVNCTPGTLAALRVGEDTTLPTSMVVREESLTLFGFHDEDERSTFELLQTASGVGPKLAQAMLAVHSPEGLRRAVADDDVTSLTAVPGIGQKGAQRIILELRDRLGAPGSVDSDAPATAAPSSWRDQVRQGLLGLGWSAREAEQAVDSVAPEARAQAEDGAEPNVALLLRSALRMLSRT
jgi:Holliday junction DNA helicase RuvA